ncbi:thiol peroxidase [Clostridium paraputrificum]|uniref:Putative thiol peroxidase n=1 Tax=Clostridium paraputrificum TaxID=29363 RepID=A0A6N3CLY7_9CLOT|nr:MULTISPECIES: thiol peroxidase [Clostridium]MBS5987041.1 thiol peroxidase [Clostridium sp.]
MKKITFKGTDITLEGSQLSVGDTLKSCILVGNDLNEVELTKTNGIRVILSVPSIDTPVCDTEVRRFNKEIESLPNAHCYTVSMDLPFAQARWCGAAGINRVTTLSDYKYKSFGDTTGTYIKELGLLTRASFVVDENNKVIFVEYLDEVANEPSYDKIISVVKNAI